MLLLVEAALPGQARAVRHSVRVRVLPSALPHQELADHTQESAAPRLQRHAEAPAKDVRHQERARAATAPPPSPSSNASARQSLRLHQRAGTATTGHPIGFQMECDLLENPPELERGWARSRLLDL